LHETSSCSANLRCCIAAQRAEISGCRQAAARSSGRIIDRKEAPNQTTLNANMSNRVSEAQEIPPAPHPNQFVAFKNYPAHWQPPADQSLFLLLTWAGDIFTSGAFKTPTSPKRQWNAGS
jgi:hypothetical protein